MAGLWERWRESEDAEPLDSCTIVTTGPNELVGELHNRMPAILSPEDYDLWLDRSVEQPKQLGELLKPYPAIEMKVVAVSTAVNNPANEGAELIETDDQLEERSPDRDPAPGARGN